MGEEKAQIFTKCTSSRALTGSHVQESGAKICRNKLSIIYVIYDYEFDEKGQMSENKHSFLLILTYTHLFLSDTRTVNIVVQRAGELFNIYI